MTTREPAQPIFYLHTRCCNAHWELVLRPDGSAMLECEACGKPIGQDLFETLRRWVAQHLAGDVSCDACDEEANP